MNSHKNLFIIILNLFSSTGLLILLISSYILRTKIDKFSPWQCFTLHLISIQEKANKNKLSPNFNTKSTTKINKLKTKNISYLKRQLNQVCFIAWPHWQLLCQVSENEILHPNIHGYLKNNSIFKKEKKRAWFILMFFSTKLLLKKKL